MEYGNGIVGDMCVHMFDMTRWMLGRGWPIRVSSEGGILVDKKSKANISDTQTATFDYDDLKVIWQHRTWGSSPDPKYDWAATFYGDKGTLKVSVYSYDFTPAEGSGAVHRDVTYELEQYPEDKTEPDLEKHCAPAIRHHMQNFLACVQSRREQDLHDPLVNAVPSADLCHLANISYRVGRALKIEPGPVPKFTGDAEATKMITRPVYRKPYEV